MSWTNIILVLRRELRDQLRDRRTLFMIAVLPILFYPLLGVSFFQIAQFLQQHPSQVLVLGIEKSQTNQQMLESLDFAARFSGINNEEKIKWIYPTRKYKWDLEERAASQQEMTQIMRLGEFDLILSFPPNYFQRLEKYPGEFREHVKSGGEGDAPSIPQVQVVSDTSQDKTALAHSRVERVLHRLSEDVGRLALESSNLPAKSARPAGFRASDLAKEDGVRIDASLWSKVLPFVMLIWALTGAFYPAVDLCAGEKERGTLETLLCSPAQRSEIVMGKLLTVLIFSIATALLNLISMGITGAVVMQQLESLAKMADVGPPPLFATMWLGVVLVPVAALFSAICLSLAAFARSTKEGQYYLMPVILVAMPLILVPMAPSAELSLEYSLVPVSGAVLLMRSIMEGTFFRLWPYAIPVMIVTLGCTWMAVRWAIDLFSSESVLFREGEQWDLRSWLNQLFRDRDVTPTVAMGAMCAVTILIIRFFMSLFFEPPRTFFEFAKTTTILQLVAILTPALMMTIFLTRSVRETLRLKMPRLGSLAAAALLALAIHPILFAIQMLAGQHYDLGPQERALTELLTKLLVDTPFILTFLVIAVLPAICEEFAFRGFILSGLRRSGHKWRAIIMTAFVFGILHAVFMQSVMAAMTGIILGYIVVQSGSIWPAIVYHMTNNGVICLLAKLDAFQDANPQTRPFFEWLYYVKIPGGEDMRLYNYGIMALGLLIAMRLLVWFRDLPYERTREETIQEARGHEAAPSLSP